MRTSSRLLLAPTLLAVALAAGCATTREASSTGDAMPVAPAEGEAVAAVDAIAGGPAADTGTTVENVPTVDADTTAAAPSTLEGGAPPAVANDGRTQAEQDYDVLFGEEPYNPVADPTLPTPAERAAAYDPWEPLNRRIHTFNNAVDRTIATPLAKAYVRVVPRPVRLGVTNFFNNLGQPVSAVNALLQGKPKQAGQSLGRFVMNTTLGIGGIFDPATSANIPNRSEDFGQTLGVWGWKNSRFVELPLFGPRTLRDSFGLIGDAPLSPTRQVSEDSVRYGLQGLQLVDLRTQLFALDAMRQGATDEYALVRDAWMQRRQYQIFGDREDEEEALPDYLRDDEDNPTPPVDVMPIIPGVSSP